MKSYQVIITSLILTLVANVAMGYVLYKQSDRILLLSAEIELSRTVNDLYFKEQMLMLRNIPTFVEQDSLHNKMDEQNHFIRCLELKDISTEEELKKWECDKVFKKIDNKILLSLDTETF